MDRLFSLSEIHFFAGEENGRGGTVIQPSPVTIIVGPNNSGKSTALREIQQLYTGSSIEGVDRKVVADLKVIEPTNWNDLLGAIEPWKIAPTRPPYRLNGGLTPQDQDTHSLLYGVRGGPTVSLYENAVLSHESFPRDLRIFAEFLVLPLDGHDRLQLMTPSPIEGGSDEQFSLQSHMYYNPEVKSRVSQLIHDVFGYHIEVDATDHRQYWFRLSREPLPDDLLQKINREAEEAFAAMPPIQVAGDGLLSFTGLIAAATVLPYKLILIDEPEAFLHPPLARRLGRELTETVTNNRASLVAATHSAAFLMGCVEQNLNVTVIRLTFEQDIATVSSLKPADIEDLMLDPILRSVNVLDALFHRCAVVVEGAADRAFYDECNRRLRNASRGIEDCLFLTATGRDDSDRIVKALRKTGLPTAVLLDFDTLGSNSFKRILESCVPDRTGSDSLMRRRDEFLHLLKPMADEIRQNGMSAMEPAEAGGIQRLIGDLGAHGLFLVPNGALESWLSELDVPAGSGSKSKWLSRIFERMGKRAGDPHYVEPGDEDVWAFIDEIAAWLSAQNTTQA